MTSTICECLVDQSNVPSLKLHSLIVAFAKGEVGLIISRFVASSENGITLPGQVHFFTDSVPSDWQQTVAELHRTHSKIVF
jgi:2,4-dienoyl-CoA reductase-like NADH-dependent reductase (Old Yellow Enzyme family)